MNKRLLIGIVILISIFVAGCESSDIGAGVPKGEENIAATAEHTEEVEITNYQDYSEASLASSLENAEHTVLFFHANWCGTCRGAESQFKGKHYELVKHGINILKVNYDAATELKKKYQIVLQHSFVEVDKDGNAIKKWSGGSLPLMIQTLKTQKNS